MQQQQQQQKRKSMQRAVIGWHLMLVGSDWLIDAWLRPLGDAGSDYRLIERLDVTLRYVNYWRTLCS